VFNGRNLAPLCKKSPIENATRFKEETSNANVTARVSQKPGAERAGRRTNVFKHSPRLVALNAFAGAQLFSLVMEVEVASVSSIGALPRLRVSRNSHASFSGHSSSRGGQDRTPQFTSHFRHSPLYPDSQTTSEDELGMDTYGPNSRLMSASLPPADSSAPSSNDTTYRLKALLERFDNASRMPISLDRSNMPPSPPEPDSEVDILPSQSARASIRSLIDDALREPGDTPQKSLVKRRASFDASGSPKIDQGKRKSNSDDDPGGTSS